MDKIALNLLPSDIQVVEKNKNKRSFFIRLAVLILLVMVLITGLFLLLRYSQDQQLARSKQQYQAQVDQVNQYQTQSNLVFYLKSRLQDISSLQNQTSLVVQSYNFLIKLTPPGVTYSSITLDKAQLVVVSGSAKDSSSLKQFFSNLTDPKVNQNKVTKVSIDSFSKNDSGIYQIDLTITLS